ncbi:MAG: UBP-type zinc finger domain-containing protein [Ornithinibacter sp.]
MSEPVDGVDLAVPPSGPGCVECTEAGGWWVHLRRCAACGHVGCCDSSPGQHASAHAAGGGHPIMRSYEPGEDWWYDVRNASFGRGLDLAPPMARPIDQPSPGPAGAVPDDWREHLNT